jgi:haloalkane dehalogenase
MRMQNSPAISSDFPFAKKRIALGDSAIAYVDEGNGQPVVFLHGNPTSSYLWRNIIPYVLDDYRVIAPDLIGMGDSDKPDIAYSFKEHAAYIDALIARLALKDIILVVHDWGSAIGMRYARQNPDNVAGLVFMEALIPPAMPAPSYEAMGPEAGEMFRALRTEGVGDKLVLEDNFFVEEILFKNGVVRSLSDAEKDAYRAPFKTRESRLPTLQWPREIPIADTPEHTTQVITENGTWLAQTDIPKLLFHAEPGALIPLPVAQHLGDTLQNIHVENIGSGLHFLQEDQPHAIGNGLADWLKTLPST